MGPAGGGAQLSGFSRHVSYFTDARGTGVRRSGRIPITNFANTPSRTPATVRLRPSRLPSCAKLPL